jgi:hypothetical protein
MQQGSNSKAYSTQIVVQDACLFRTESTKQ